MKEIDWANLSFGYMKTDYNVRINFRNGAWGELEISSSEVLNLHMAATCLHYGQEAFEGLKAFRGKDGKVRIFRLEENAARLQSTCQGIMMAELPTERFKEAILKVVKLNERFIPPYESGASLYIRPLLIGTSARWVSIRQMNICLLYLSHRSALISRVASLPILMSLSASTTVLRLTEPVSTKSVETMQPVCAPIRRLTTWVIPASSIWTQKRKNTLTNVVRPTSLVLKTIPTSLRSLLPSSFHHQ